MKTFRGGEQVVPGQYVSLKSGQFIQRSDQETVLPGGTDVRYIRVPMLLTLLTGPILGLLFVIFLPVLGILGLLVFVGHKLTRLASWTAQETARVLAPSWVPGVSYLTRAHRDGERQKTQDGMQIPEDNGQFLENIERELQERRRSGEK